MQIVSPIRGATGSSSHHRTHYFIATITTWVILAIAAPSAYAAWGFETIPPPSAPVEPPAAAVGTATYTFETPAFLAGSSTPLLNRTPNSNTGPAGFLASFTAAVLPTGFMVNNFQPNPLTIGQVLFDPGDPAEVLTIACNMPIESLSFGFATIVAGRLDLTSTAGYNTMPSGNVGGAFPGGTFTFSPGVPFNSFTLSAFNTNNQPIVFAIDNLALAIVPEPSGAMLLFAACAVSLARRRARGEI